MANNEEIKTTEAIPETTPPIAPVIPETTPPKEYKCSNCGCILVMSDDDTGQCPKCGLMQSVTAGK